jgi:hypothetical protein
MNLDAAGRFTSTLKRRVAVELLKCGTLADIA